MILQSLLATLPEVSILTSFEHDAKSTDFWFDWYEFISLFRVAGGAIALVAAIVWISLFLNCCLRLWRAQEWTARLCEAYEKEILPQTDMLAVRRYSTVFLLLNVAILFTFHLRIDYHTALPGAVAAILTLISLRLQKNRTETEGKCRAACYGLAVVSILQLIVNFWFLQNFLPEASLYQTDAYYGFLALRILEAAEAIATLIYVGMLLKVLFEWMCNEVFVQYDGGASADAFSQKATERLHREFAKRFAVVFILFAAHKDRDVSTLIDTLHSLFCKLLKSGNMKFFIRF